MNIKQVQTKDGEMADYLREKGGKDWTWRVSFQSESTSVLEYLDKDHNIIALQIFDNAGTNKTTYISQ